MSSARSLERYEVEEVLKRSPLLEFVKARCRDEPEHHYILLRPVPSARGAASVIESVSRLATRRRLRAMLPIGEVIPGGDGPTVVYTDPGTTRIAPSLPVQDLDAFCGVALAMLEAIEEVHSAQIVLQNVELDGFVTAGRRAYILDFSNAMTVSREYLDFESAWSLATNPHYLSPEQSGRVNRAVDYRADYYALGVAFHRLLTGVYPFEASDPNELIYLHLTKRPERASEREPQVPELLSDIVEKLLAKDPGRRYQSGEGLRGDLLRVRRGERRTTLRGPVGMFDVPGRLEGAHKLYGREAERAALLEAYARACEGRREVVLLTGPPGIGKSRLIREAYLPATRQKAYFVSCKFDQLARATPYSAWRGALRSLVELMLTEPDAHVKRWRERILTAVGANVAVLLELVPLLETLLGPQPSLSMLTPGDAQTRLLSALCNFFGAFGERTQPLAILLDDVQWADPASLTLIEQLMCGQERVPPFLVLSARDNEIEANRPLGVLLDRLGRSTTELTRITVGQLQVSAITELLEDTLSVRAEQAAELAEMLAKKTGGNPLFVLQILRGLCASGLLRFDVEAMRWVWERETILGLQLSPNVLSLVLLSLEDLPAATRDAVACAACIGNSFELDVLRNLLGLSEEEVITSLDAAVSRDLIVAERRPRYAGARRTFRFAHDRIQEAAYKTLSEEQRAVVHRRLAERILLAGEASGDHIFLAADHLNSARSTLASREDWIMSARTNLAAAERSLHSGAFGAALSYSRAAMAALPEGLAETDHELWRSLHRVRSECEYLDGQIVDAKGFAQTAIARERDPFIKADLLHMLVVHSTLRAEYSEAIATARSALELFGVVLPDRDIRAHRDRELARVHDLLAESSQSDRAPWRVMADAKQSAIMRLLTAMGPPCYRSNAELWELIVAMEVRLCLEHGYIGKATYSLPAFAGLIMQLGRGEPALVNALLVQTRRIMAELGTPAEISVGYLMLGSSLCHWVSPLATSVDEYLQAYATGIASGNLQYAAYALGHHAYCAFYRGGSLTGLVGELHQHLEFATRRGNRWATDLIDGVLRVVSAICAGTHPGTFDRAQVTEAEFVDRCRQHGNVQVLGIYHVLKAEALLHLREVTRAAEAVLAASSYISCVRAPGLYPFTQFEVLNALVGLMEPQALGLEREAALDSARQTIGRLRAWAKGSPANFEHSLWLLQAEVSRREGNTLEAITAYDRSISAARAAGMQQRMALAAELASEWWRSEGQSQFSRLYLAKAAAGYQTWRGGGGALRAELAAAPSDEVANGGAQWGLGLQDFVRAAQAFTSSAAIDDMLPAVIKLASTLTGAQRVALVLQEEGSVRCIGDTGSSGAEAEGGPAQLPLVLCQYVFRSRQPVQVDRQSDFCTRDPYLAERCPSSARALPIFLVGRVEGVLYLEHADVDDAFDDRQLRLAEFLASNAIITIRNGALLAQLRRDIELRMAAETKLRESERRFRVLIEQSPQGLQIFDRSGRLVQDNESWDRLWRGRAVPKDLSSHPLLSGIEGDLRTRLSVGEVVDLGEHVMGGAPGVVPTWVSGRAYGVRDPEGDVEQVVVALEDVTERKRLERSKVDFVATISHELRTPLTSIRGALGLIACDVVPKGSQEWHELVVAALDNSERLAKLVDDILDLDKLSVGALRVYSEIVCLVRVAGDAVARIEGFAVQHNVRVRLDDATPDAQLWVLADVERLGQVLANLLSNAIKFSRAGDEVVVRCFSHDGRARVEVSDHGFGVPEAFKGSLFVPFAQADGSDARQRAGTGLGLSICRGLVERMGGKVGYESREPSGSCFYFELELAPNDRATRGVSASGRARGGSIPPSARAGGGHQARRGPEPGSEAPVTSAPRAG